MSRWKAFGRAFVAAKIYAALPGRSADSWKLLTEGEQASYLAAADAAIEAYERVRRGDEGQHGQHS
jgi:hypothetical protein